MKVFFGKLVELLLALLAILVILLGIQEGELSGWQFFWGAFFAGGAILMHLSKD